MKKKYILILGACGQIGIELTALLREKYGWQRIIAADIWPSTPDLQQQGLYVQLDVRNKRKLVALMRQREVIQIYHLAAVLSATGEKNPVPSWDINMQGLLNVLEIARDYKVEQVFWPSSIAVFGRNSGKACPQFAYPDPATVYGISKNAGEHWCQYYFEKYGLDVRSLRYPGLISYKGKPGGGTTDYAADIFHQALNKGHYTCFLRPDVTLPMMYMPDALRATLELMEAPAERLRVRSSYNLSALSFSPAQLAAEIRQNLPDFKISYAPDFRQAIAETWPASIDDTQARADWGWKEAYDLPALTTDMLQQLTPKNAMANV